MQSHQFVLAVRFIFVLLCIIGAITHCFYISVRYFSFRVREQVSPFVPLDLFLPKLSLCFALDTVLTHQPEKFFFYENEVIFGRTIGYLKNVTPPADQVMSGCAYRDWQTDSVMFAGPSECLQYFKVEKMTIQRYICYKFSPPPVNYSFFEAISSFERRRMLYQVSISAPLNQGHRILPIIHHSDLPFYEQVYVQEMLPSVNESELCLLSDSSFISSSLPAPYESRCKEKTRRECFLSCAAHEYSRLGYTDYSTMFIENDSLRIPNLSSPGVVDLLRRTDNRIRSICNSKCLRTRACEVAFAVTSTFILSRSSIDKLTFEVQTLKDPAIRIETEAAMDLLDYFTQFTSVCSFWLGFCVLQSLERRRTQSPQCIKLLCLRLMFIQSHIHNVLMRLKRNKHNVSLFLEKRAAFMRSKTRWMTITSLLVKAVALAGFISQMNCIVGKYLRYDTEINIKYTFDPKVSSPNINLCIPVTQVLSSVYQPGVTTRANFENNLMQQDENFFSNKSLSELMKIIPLPHRLIHGCRLRSNQSDVYSKLTVRLMPECMSLFRSERYFMNDQVCYNFKPTVQSSIVRQSTRSLVVSNRGIFYTLILNKSALRRRLEVYLSEEQHPFISRHFSAVIRKAGCNIISTFKRTAVLLPPPYETNCHPTRDRGECIEKCVSKNSIKKLNRFNPKGLITEEYINAYNGSRLVMFTDWRNETTGKILRGIEYQCQHRCFKPKCVSVIIKTLKSHSFRSDFTYEVAVGLRASPDQEAQAKPRTSMLSLYYQVACSANFWLGFVFVSFSLFKLKAARVKEKLIDQLNARIQLIKSFLSCLERCINRTNTASVACTKYLEQYLRAMSSKKAVMKSTIIKIATGLACSFHLFLCLSCYLQYPTFTDSDYLRDNSTNYELSVCNSYLEERSSHLFTEYGRNQSTRSQLDSAMDKILSKPVNQVMKQRPRNFLQPIGCSARGLRQQSNLSRHMKDVSDRLMFTDDGQADYCKSIFATDIFIINGLICHRFYQKQSSILKGRRALSFPHVLFSVAVNQEHLTDTFSVMVGESGIKPYYSSFWSPLIFKPKTKVYYLVSFIKYIQTVLGHPYDQALTSAITLRCVYHCSWRKLDKLNLAYASANSNRSHRFIMKSEMHQPQTQKLLRKTYRECVHSCKHFTDKEKARSYFVTQITSPSGRIKKIQAGRVEFYVMRTEYPVISLEMKAQLSFFELIISLGSVLNIWFGFCALSLDPKSSDSSTVDQDCLEQSERQLYRLSLNSSSRDSSGSVISQSVIHATQGTPRAMPLFTNRSIAPTR